MLAEYFPQSLAVSYKRLYAYIQIPRACAYTRVLLPRSSCFLSMQMGLYLLVIQVFLFGMKTMAMVD